MGRKMIGSVLLLFLLLVLAAGYATAGAFKVGIVQIVEHPALDATREGFLAALAENNVEIEVVYHSAQGDFATAAAISQQFVGDQVDLILAIATPAAQAAAHATETIPIVFAAVTDPVAAGLAASWEQPGGNVTGISDMTPVAQQLELLKEIAPDVKRVGILFNPGETNSVVQVALAEQAAQELGLRLVKAGVNSSAEVYQAASSLLNRVDAFYVPTDNTVASAIDSVVIVANQAQLPLIVGEDTLVSRGALATVGINYFDVGFAAGLAAKQIFAGANPGDLPVGTVAEFAVAVNLASASEANVEIPAKVLDRAAMIIE